MSDEVASPKISVVVPIYKVEKYLRECVESVLAQSFTDFELILVDDGSPDKSGEICDELAKKDPRIRVFHQANGGVTSARRLGVEQARGEWINFVDADDLVAKDALETLIAEASDDIDWVQGMKQRFNDGETPKIEPRTGNVKIFDQIGLAENMLLYHPASWGKIVRRKLFTPYVLDIPRDIKFAEDMLMNIKLIANKPRKPKEIDKVVYHYRISEGSIVRSHLVTENYILRLHELFLAEIEKLPTSGRECVERALEQHACRLMVRLIVYGLPIKFPRRLAGIMHHRAKTMGIRGKVIYLCLRAGCPSIAHFTAKVCHFLHGMKFDARDKKLLE